MEKGNFLVYDAYENYNGVCKLFGEFFFFLCNCIHDIRVIELFLFS